MAVLKWILIIVGGLAAVGVVVFTGGLARLSRNQPQTEDIELGVTDGRLTDCPDTPNCVSTQADPSDSVHYVEPIGHGGSPDDVMSRLVAWIENQERAEIVRTEERYIRAVFSSRVFGFQDDVEILVEPEVVHVRSASRVGQGDMGVNRDRYTRIRDVVGGAGVDG